MSLPFADLAAELAPERESIEAAIRRVLESGTFIGGPEVEGFERELAAALGVAHVVGTSSGTDALSLLLMALRIGAGDEVVTTPFSFIASAASAARLGARVVFSDIDPETLLIDPAAARAACTASTRAVIPVALFGAPLPPLDVTVPVIVDAAQAIGSTPPRGLGAAYSFFPTKNLGALGDGGAVTTNDADLAARVRRLRAHGASPKYHHVELGGNCRLDAIQAAILRVRLPRLPDAIAARRALADGYRHAFRAARVPAELRLPLADPQHGYHQFVIRAPRRDALRDALARQGIETAVYYPEPLHLQPCFAHLGSTRGAFPHAEAACLEVLALPLRPMMAPDVPARVVDAIAAFYAS